VSSAAHKVPLSAFELLLQGTRLKSTDYVIGVVVYTGNESKLGKSKKMATMKWTKTDILVNRSMMVIFLFQTVTMLALGITGNVFNYVEATVCILNNFV